MYRKKCLGFDQKVGDEVVRAANVSVLLQVPQFFLVGAGEAFTSISGRKKQLPEVFLYEMPFSN